MWRASWKKRHVQRTRSRCLARSHYSIDQPQRLRETLLPKGDFAVGDGIHSRRHLPAQRTHFVRAEHHLTDARAAAAEDEVVRAERRELELRLLDQEEVLYRLW